MVITVQKINGGDWLRKKFGDVAIVDAIKKRDVARKGVITTILFQHDEEYVPSKNASEDQDARELFEKMGMRKAYGVAVIYEDVSNGPSPAAQKGCTGEIEKHTGIEIVTSGIYEIDKVIEVFELARP